MYPDEKAEALGRQIKLRWELLMLAGLLTPAELIAAADLECDLGSFVGRVCATPGLTVTAAALMACCLARYASADEK